ncbi:NADP-dependent oxidoreductase domain-containing protein 1 [Aplysia californica]|uniref:NADP-dependent oxidoreductase domain-containing protein 1 n=1 Tax=Aplysia californica TaxID=6500 RepID=A0ABM0JIX2_APLCA|nr:NADP-dependent oxidoreductase domain-containing protein 1 [Aplysia californica]
MALVTRLQASQKQETTNDITRNLLSLQFESALTDEEREFLDLRARNHAISVTQCALVTVMVDIFKKAREMKMNIVNPDKKRTTQILQDEGERDSLIVGIIGCGRLGSQIAHCLLTYGQIHPKKLQISTRRPETLEYLQHKGVECYYNNERLISSVHVAIFCVLPSQMQGVAEDIKDYVSSSLIMICPFSSLSLRRLRQMLRSSNVIRPVLHWDKGPQDRQYNHSVNINTALENKETLLGTCPVGVDKSNLVVWSDERLFDIIVLAVINMCADQGITQAQTLTVIHAAVFGETHKKPLACEPLTVSSFDLPEGKETSMPFPFSDLVDAHESGSPLMKNIRSNEGIVEVFVKRYCFLFEDYIHKRAYGQLS